MQPLGLQNRASFTAGLAGTAGTPGTLLGNSGTAGASPLGQSKSAGFNSMASMGPLLLQLMQSILMILQQMMSSQGGGIPGGKPGSPPPGEIPGNPYGGNPGSPPTGDIPGGSPKSPSAGDIPGGNPKSPPAGDIPGGSPKSPPAGDIPGDNPKSPPAGDNPESPPAGDLPTTPDNPLPNNLPGGAQGTGQALNQPIDQIRGLDYTKLTETQRNQFNGLSRDSAAVIHLGGRATISGAVTANGVSPAAQIYNNVLKNPGNFKPSETALVTQWSKDEIARRGIITGENLDHAFIDEMGLRDGMSAQQLQPLHSAVNQRVSDMLANPNKAAVKADTEKSLNLVDDINTLQQQSGLTKTEQAAFRLGGHAVLFSGDGKVNGDILAITMGNANALDNKGGNNGSIDAETQSIAKADMADDGQLNGSSLRLANSTVLNKIYGGGTGIKDNQQIENQGVQAGLSNGRSMQDIQKSILKGGAQALQDFKKLAKDHSPAMLAAGATMAGAAAVCPFLGGMAAGAAGIGAAQKMMNQDKSQAKSA